MNNKIANSAVVSTVTICLTVALFSLDLADAHSQEKGTTKTDRKASASEEDQNRKAELERIQSELIVVQEKLQLASKPFWTRREEISRKQLENNDDEEREKLAKEFRRLQRTEQEYLNGVGAVLVSKHDDLFTKWLEGLKLNDFLSAQLHRRPDIYDELEDNYSPDKWKQIEDLATLFFDEAKSETQRQQEWEKLRPKLLEKLKRFAVIQTTESTKEDKEKLLEDIQQVRTPIQFMKSFAYLELDLAVSDLRYEEKFQHDVFKLSRELRKSMIQEDKADANVDSRVFLLMIVTSNLREISLKQFCLSQQAEIEKSERLSRIFETNNDDVLWSDRHLAFELFTHFDQALGDAEKQTGNEKQIEFLQDQHMIAARFAALTQSRAPVDPAGKNQQFADDYKRIRKGKQELYKATLPQSIADSESSLKQVAFERMKEAARILDGCGESFLSARLTLLVIQYDQ